MKQKLLIKSSLFLLLALFSFHCLGCAGSAGHRNMVRPEKNTISEHQEKKEAEFPEDSRVDRTDTPLDGKGVKTEGSTIDEEGSEALSDAAPGRDDSDPLDNKSSSEPALKEEAVTGRAAPPMNYNHLMLAIIEEAGSRFTPVRYRDGSLLMITADLDQNGQEDPLVLTVERGERSPIFEDLTDVSRLYDPQQGAINYYLSVYFQIQGKLVSMYRIPFGGRKVLGSFDSFLLQTGEALPLGIEVSFQNREGSSQERVIFSRHNRFSLFSSRSTVSSGTYLQDIDNDGTLDLIEWKTGIEEGTGYETFLTWYKWNGSAFQQHRYTNIVRNLNSFLSEVESALLGNSLHAVKPFLSREDTGKMEQRNGTEGLSDFSCQQIQSIVYPPILESPFQLDTADGRSFHLDLRALCKTGETGLFRVKITLQENPFQDPQFTLSLK